MMGGFGGGMGGLGLFGGLLSALLTIGLLAGLVFLGIWLWRRFGASEGVSSWVQSQGTRQPTAREILQTRYARGEIDREEFERMKELLSS
jgi:putative membrane protein